MLDIQKNAYLNGFGLGIDHQLRDRRFESFKSLVEEKKKKVLRFFFFFNHSK